MRIRETHNDTVYVEMTQEEYQHISYLIVKERVEEYNEEKRNGKRVKGIK